MQLGGLSCKRDSIMDIWTSLLLIDPCMHLYNIGKTSKWSNSAPTCPSISKLKVLSSIFMFFASLLTASGISTKGLVWYKFTLYFLSQMGFSSQASLRLFPKKSKFLKCSENLKKNCTYLRNVRDRAKRTKIREHTHC